jgi:hypothetical protein
VASKPNDLAGKRRGFGSRHTAGNGNKNGSKPIGIDKYNLNMPGPDPCFRAARCWKVMNCKRYQAIRISAKLQPVRSGNARITCFIVGRNLL